MDISVQSSDLITALSERIAQMTVELETTRLALNKAQEYVTELQKQQLAAQVQKDYPETFLAVPEGSAAE